MSRIIVMVSVFEEILGRLHCSAPLLLAFWPDERTIAKRQPYAAMFAEVAENLSGGSGQRMDWDWITLLKEQADCFIHLAFGDVKLCDLFMTQCLGAPLDFRQHAHPDSSLQWHPFQHIGLTARGTTTTPDDVRTLVLNDLSRTIHNLTNQMPRRCTLLAYRLLRYFRDTLDIKVGSQNE